LRSQALDLLVVDRMMVGILAAQSGEHIVAAVRWQQRHLFAQARRHPGEQEVITILRQVDHVRRVRQRPRHVLRLRDELRGAYRGFR
jgi:hypothetical protein